MRLHVYVCCYTVVPFGCCSHLDYVTFTVTFDFAFYGYVCVAHVCCWLHFALRLFDLRLRCCYVGYGWLVVALPRCYTLVYGCPFVYTVTHTSLRLRLQLVRYFDFRLLFRLIYVPTFVVVVCSRCWLFRLLLLICYGYVPTVG